MRHIVLTCLSVLVVFSMSTAQQDVPTFLPEDRQIITPDNIDELKPIGELGDGLLYDTMLLDDGTLVVVTSRGVRLYENGNLNAQPRWINYQPNPFGTRYATFQNAETTLIGDQLTVSNDLGAVQVDLVSGETQRAADDITPISIVSSDGRLFASSDMNTQLITVTDISSDATIAEIAIDGITSQVVFNDDASGLFVIGRFNDEAQSNVQLWDISTNARLATFSALELPQQAYVAENRLFLALRDQTAILDATTLEQIDMINADVTGIVGDAYLLLVENEETRLIDIILQDIASGQEVTRIASAMCTIGNYRLHYAEATNTLYAATIGVAGGIVRAWNIDDASPELIGELVNFRNPAVELAFSNDGTSLYVVYNSSNPFCSSVQTGDNVSRYDMTSGTLAERLPFSPDMLTVSVATNANDDVVVGGLGTTGWQFGDDVTRIETETGFVSSVAITDSGALYGYVDNNIIELNRTGDIVRTVATDVRGIFSTPGWGTAIIAEDNLLMYVGADNTAFVEDAISGETLHTVTPERPIKGLVYDAESDLLGVHVGENEFDSETLHEVQFYRVGNTLEPISTAEVYTLMHMIDLSPGGAILGTTIPNADVSADSLAVGETAVHFYDTASGERIGGLDDFNLIYPIAFSPDGTYLVLSGGSGNLIIYGITGTE